MSADHQKVLRDLISAARAYADLRLGAPENLTLVLMTGVSTIDADADMVDAALISISARHHLLNVHLVEELLEAQEQLPRNPVAGDATGSRYQRLGEEKEGKINDTDSGDRQSR